MATHEMRRRSWTPMPGNDEIRDSISKTITLWRRGLGQQTWRSEAGRAAARSQTTPATDSRPVGASQASTPGHEERDGGAAGKTV